MKKLVVAILILMIASNAYAATISFDVPNAAADEFVTYMTEGEENAPQTAGEKLAWLTLYSKGLLKREWRHMLEQKEESVRQAAIQARESEIEN